MKRAKLGRFNRYIKPEREPLSTKEEDLERGRARRMVEDRMEEKRMKMTIYDELFR